MCANSIHYFLASLLLLEAAASPSAHSATGPTAEISPWLHGKAGALSLTFDDGIRTQFTDAVPILNESGIKATFFITTNFVSGYWDLIKKASDAGHEIASHAMSHPDFEMLTDSLDVEREIRGSKEAIEARLPGKACLTFAWPYGNKSPLSRKVAARHFISSRTAGGAFEPASPSDFVAIRGVSFDQDVDVAFVNTEVEKTIFAGKWMVEIIHGIGELGYKPLSAANLKEHFGHIKSRESELWIATYADVVRYARERMAATLRWKAIDESAMSLNLTDTLPDSIFDHPLTVRMELPWTWNGAKASQGSSPLEVRLERSADVLTAYIDAVPDRGEIRIERNGIFDPDASPPAFTVRPAGGYFTAPARITLIVRPKGGIQYALGETAGAPSWTDITESFTLDRSARVGFRSVDGSGKESPHRIMRFAINTASLGVTANPSGGTLDSGRTVRFDCTGLANVHFTRDGSEPDTNSQIYTYPITVHRSMRLKFFARDMAGNRTPVDSQSYLVDGKPIAISGSPVFPAKARISGAASMGTEVDALGRCRMRQATRRNGSLFFLVPREGGSDSPEPGDGR